MLSRTSHFISPTRVHSRLLSLFILTKDAQLVLPSLGVFPRFSLLFVDEASHLVIDPFFKDRADLYAFLSRRVSGKLLSCAAIRDLLDAVPPPGYRGE